jgi:V-type H+-transporting ATPase subunit G
MKLLKQAKEEAASEIEAYKKEKEKSHKNLEHATLGNKSTAEDTIKIKTEETIVTITANLQSNKDAVLKHLLATIENVVPKQHENLII